MATLDALHDQPDSTAEDVLRAVRRQLRRVSDQAVYDSLRTLTDAGLLNCSQPTGRPPRWSLNNPAVGTSGWAVDRSDSSRCSASACWRVGLLTVRR